MLLNLRRSVDSIKWSLRIPLCTIRWCSAARCGTSEGDDGSSFATYLMRSFGVTKNSATKAANNRRVSKVENCNALVAFFKDEGFSDIQVSKLIRSRPILLNQKPHTLKRKIEFLKSRIPEPHCVMSTYPALLTTSLENRLIPSFNFLINLLGSERDAANAVRRAADVLLADPKCIRNLEILKKYGVPRSNLAILLIHRSPALKLSSALIEESIEDLRKMGFQLNATMFVIALRIRLMLRKQKWEEKVALFEKFGWSEEDFLQAFKRNPYVAMHSVGKVSTTMNYMKELGIDPCRIAKYSYVLGMSFEKRIIPRSSVYKALASKGLIRRSISLYSFYCATEDRFVKKFVSRYSEVIGLSELYQEKLELARHTLKKL